MDVSSIGLLAALGAGFVSFLSPCVLPLVPGYLSYVAGTSLDDLQQHGSLAAKLPALGLSASFVLGFSTVFLALGASATALGQLLLQYRYEANIAGGSIVILFGLLMLGLVRLRWLHRDLRFHAALAGGRPVAAYVLGLAFAFGWTPCIGPVLGAILTVSATSVRVAEGILLLGIYSLGLGIPFLLSAVFTGSLMRRLRSAKRLGRVLELGAGGVMVLMGLAMITGRLTDFSYWLLGTFPGLANIG